MFEVFTHRCTAGLDFQNGFLHIHRIVFLQTQGDMNTVPSPEGSTVSVCKR